MTVAFDPYYKWLGIAPDEQPANYYRLLGVAPLEPDPDVIEHAADQRMTYLRSLQTGQNAAHCQRLLNEISSARVCLLNPLSKASYDALLQPSSPTVAPPVAPPPPPLAAPPAIARPATEAPPSFAEVGEPAGPRAKNPVRRTPRKSSPAVWLGVVCGAALAALFFVVRAVMAPPAPGVVLLEWDDQDRTEVTLKVDDLPRRIPPTGPVQVSCPPGRHRLNVARPGFRPLEELVELRPGERKTFRLNWERQTMLILRWPEQERTGARLEIDGRLQTAPASASYLGAISAEFPLEPGEHVLRIARPGFRMFEEKFRLDEGELKTLVPAWVPEEVASLGPGLMFDGDDVVLTKMKFDAAKPLTVEAVVTPVTDKDGAIVGDRQFAGIALSVEKGKWAFQVHGPELHKYVYSPSGVTPGRRVHVAGTWIDGELCLFVAGEKMGDNRTKGGKYLSSRYPVFLGADPGPGGRPEHFFHGVIHAVRVSQSVRYESLVSPPKTLERDADTLLLMRFDRLNAGDVARDYSGRGNDSRIVGGEWVGVPAR